MLLVDDLVASRWTLTIAGQLVRCRRRRRPAATDERSTYGSRLAPLSGGGGGALVSVAVGRRRARVRRPVPRPPRGFRPRTCPPRRSRSVPTTRLRELRHR